jgi:hypothetical protein
LSTADNKFFCVQKKISKESERPNQGLNGTKLFVAAANNVRSLATRDQMTGTAKQNWIDRLAVATASQNAELKRAKLIHIGFVII